MATDVSIPNNVAEASPSCSLLVSSCDAYSDLWTPFFNLFWKNWPDCPFPVYLLTNHQTFSHANVTSLCTGDDKAWSDQLRVALSRLDTKYVLLMLEDFFLRRPVQNQDVLTGLQALHRLGGSMLRLVPRPPPDESVSGFPSIGHIRPGAPYRVSTQSSIWRRQDLLNLMAKGESIWDFEVKGSRRSDASDGYYAAWKSALPYDHHVVERGKWFRNEAVRFARLGIGCDFSRRPVMTSWDTARWRVAMLRGQVLQLLPWPQRLRLVSFLRKVLDQ